ncbi:DUF4145 domain-containing protein [Agromyces chitinivorans]|uniref:DUF4145 domain-containing protein n=1 Tax=Agromyces chitinivorans TaxID=3158560 RepID=UPI003F518BC8
MYSVDDASGRTREEGFEETGYVDEYSVYYAVEYFSPPLTLVLLPEGTPQEVCQAVERAARLLYLDPGLAATALRSSVEGYLTSQGVPRTSKSGGFLSLDKRLQDWRNATSHEREADLLLAVKWIGNSGTHEAGELTARDVLDGVRFIDEAFHSLYIAPDVDANAQAVSARRGRSTTQVTTS